MFTQEFLLIPYAQFVAFDLETTGLKAETNHIIEVGGFKFTFELENSKLKIKELGTFNELVKPPMHIPQEATKVNGITNEMVENAPPAVEVLKKFTQFCGLSSILVAHNADFDSKFLQNELHKNGLIIPQNPIVDSLKISRKIMPESPNHKLGTLAARLKRFMNLKVKPEELHRALYDCRVLAEVFTVLLNKRFQANEFSMTNAIKSLEKVHGPAFNLK